MSVFWQEFKAKANCATTGGRYCVIAESESRCSKKDIIICWIYGLYLHFLPQANKQCIQKYHPRFYRLWDKWRSCHDATNFSCFFYASCWFKCAYCQVMNSLSTYNGSLTNHVSYSQTPTVISLRYKSSTQGTSPLLRYTHTSDLVSHRKCISASINRRFACAQTWTHKVRSVHDYNRKQCSSIDLLKPGGDNQPVQTLKVHKICTDRGEF